MMTIDSAELQRFFGVIGVQTAMALKLIVHRQPANTFWPGDYRLLVLDQCIRVGGPPVGSS